jgi:hypothetical protein
VRESLVAVTVALAVLASRDAAASPPRADLIVVWAPARDVAPIAAVARELGIALVDRSPESAEPPNIDVVIKRGIDAYEALQLDTAWAQFEDARRQLDATGGAAVTTTQLSNLFVYRGLVRAQRGDDEGAWEELVTANVVAPTRVYDPGRFPPRTIAELERARKAAVGAPIAVAVDAPAACTLVVDGAPAGRVLSLVRGPHWLAARCPGAAPWGRRIDVTEATTRVRVDAAPLAPPGEAELLIQARAAGTRGLVIVEVRGTLAVARLVGLDGKERARRTATIDRTLDPAATAVRQLVAPVESPKWYRSRWVWAAGGALALAAIVIPIALIANDDPPSGVRVVGPGELPP